MTHLKPCRKTLTTPERYYCWYQVWAALDIFHSKKWSHLNRSQALLVYVNVVDMKVLNIEMVLAIQMVLALELSKGDRYKSAGRHQTYQVCVSAPRTTSRKACAMSRHVAPHNILT